ncbi:TnsA endonuclease N-terminal domain-containing protein [Aneurinibacillus sp. REN35]
MIHCESSIERDYVRIADYDPNILEIIHQPLAIPYLYKHRKRDYYPDFKVLTKDGLVRIVEIKPTSKIKKPENEIKFLVGRLYCEKMGWNYCVVTDVQLRQGYLQRNLSLLRALADQHIPIQKLKYVLQMLRDSGDCTIEMLRENCNNLNSEEFYKAIYSLIYYKKVYVNLISDKLTDISIVSCGRTEEEYQWREYH